jgi:hypothetical protein
MGRTFAMVQTTKYPGTRFVPREQITTRRTIQHSIVVTHKQRIRLVVGLRLKLRVHIINLHNFASVLVLGYGDEVRAPNLLRDQGMRSCRENVYSTSRDPISKVGPR